MIILSRNKNICFGLKKVLAKSRARLLWATNFGFVARFSSSSQLFAQQMCSCTSKSTNQRAAFLQPATNVFVAGQVDHARWKTQNIDQNLQRNNVARQVEGFCISYFAALTDYISRVDVSLLTSISQLLSPLFTIFVALIGHFQVHVYLLFKTGLSAIFSYAT